MVEVRVERDVTCRARDGVALRADVYRPQARGDFPVLLNRTPYGKGGGGGLHERLAAAGYVVVVQDVRGRFASEGELTPFFAPGYLDVEDGADTVVWCAGLPGSSGRVGMWGESYSAWTAWCAALARPAALAAMFVGGMTLRLTDVEPLFRPGRRLHWMATRMAPDLRVRKRLPGPRTVAEATHLWEMERHKWLWFLPRRDLPESLFGDQKPFLDHHLQNPGQDTYGWEERLEQIDVPVLHMTGWYDRFVRGVEGFAQLRERAGSARSRAAQRLVVGPWGHSTNLTEYEGELDHGPAGRVDYGGLLLRWFDHWLKDEQNGVDEDAPARLYVLGADRWREARTWPPHEARPVDFHITSEGSANTPAGDGVLTESAPGRDAADSFDYDPRDPVVSYSSLRDQDECRDLSTLAWRRDILVYQTPPLEAAVEVVGEPVLTLYAASSALDTDFTARLVDVHPNGFAQNLCYGIVRARFRNGYDRPELLEPGRVCEYTIRLNPIAALFGPGHRLRLDVSSSDFPAWERNLNTGGDAYSETEMVTAHQTVRHGPSHPSKLTLPVVRADGAGR